MNNQLDRQDYFYLVESVSQLVVHHRHKKRYSQEELAHVSGISIRTIQRIEKGVVSPQGHTLKKLCEALEFDLDSAASEIEKDYVGELRKLNATGLLVIVAPLIHIVVQLLILSKLKPSKEAHANGSKIITFQILWILATVIAFGLIHVISYAIAGQSVIGHFPYRLLSYIALLILNISIIATTAVKLNSKSEILPWVPVLL